MKQYVSIIDLENVILLLYISKKDVMLLL